MSVMRVGFRLHVGEEIDPHRSEAWDHPNMGVLTLGSGEDYTERLFL